MPFEKGRKKVGGKKKGYKSREVLLRSQFDAVTEDSMISQIERNMNEFLNSPDPKVRMEATKYFSEFWKPKKSVQDNRYSGSITFNVNPQLTNNSPDKIEAAEFKVLSGPQ